MTFIFRIPKAGIRKRSAEAQAILDRIENYLTGNSEKPVEILVSFWKAQSAVFTYKEIRELILSGEVSETHIKQWHQDYSKLVTDHLSKLWEKSIKSGAAENDILKNINGFEFNRSHANVINWIKEHGVQFVTRVTDEQKKAIKVFLEKSVRESMSTDGLARLIRPCVGLTKSQAEANLKLYNTVKENLKTEHPKMREATVEKKAREVAVKYAEKQQRDRAYTIAQTETAHAYNKGYDLGVRQAQEFGFMGHMVKKWITSGDDKVCEICRAFEAEEVEMDETFSLEGKGKLENRKFKPVSIPPAHPRCACGVQYIEVSPPVSKQ